jgi:hypothetical protein
MRITINDYPTGFESAIASCIHETNAESKADTLVLKIKNPDHKVQKLAIRQNDIIRIENGAVTTGDMYIHKAVPVNNIFEIRAMSIPVSGTIKKSMSWQSVHLLQILKEKADALGFDLKTYGIQNEVYKFISQEEESDVAFILKLCEREGYAMIIFDRKIIVYSELYQESIEPKGTIELTTKEDVQYYDESYNGYSSFEIKAGNYSAVYTDKNISTGNQASKIVTYVDSDQEALRYAKGYLRSINKGIRHGYFTTSVDGRYAAGSVCFLNASTINEQFKKIFLTKVRYDYVAEKMKVFFRDVFLEGY